MLRNKLILFPYVSAAAHYQPLSKSCEICPSSLILSGASHPAINALIPIEFAKKKEEALDLSPPFYGILFIDSVAVLNIRVDAEREAAKLYVASLSKAFLYPLVGCKIPEEK